MRQKKTRKREKKKKKKRENVESEIADVVAEPATPLPPLRRPRRDSETRSAQSVALFKTMTPEALDTAIVLLWENAHGGSNSRYLKEEQRQELVKQVSERCQLPDLTFDALRMRVQRILSRGTFSRSPGSGRPRLWTPEHEEAAKEIARAHQGDISRQGIIEAVTAKFGRENVNGRSQMYARIGEIMKRRRIRYKPKLSDNQMLERVKYAQDSMNRGFSDEEWTIFVDEKRFEATSNGVYNLPSEDLTPTRRVQSKSNPVFVMVLLAIAAPRGEWNGIIGSHYFVERVAAAKKSKNRDAGTMEMHPLNVTKESYVMAWIGSIIPAIAKAIEDGNLPKPSANRPFLLQDDNAKPHRGLYKDGMTVTEFICKAARKCDVFLAPRDPGQPAQSPDLNPLDTFVFRVLAIKWRRLRARDLVRQMAAFSARVGRAASGEDSDHNRAVRRLDFVPSDEESGSGEENDLSFRTETVPLRCKPESTRKKALCGGCSKIVTEADRTAVQCELRFGWWHLACVKELIGNPLYERAKVPNLRSDDEIWICPQCSMHLCNNDDRTSNLCLVCWQPSNRNGDDMGSDMICCDSDAGGLFHKKCVDYDEDDAFEHDHWYCAACDTLIEDQYKGLDEIEDRPISGNNVQALKRAVDYALYEVPLKSFVRGFETRRAIIKKVLEAEGKNNYDMHWRKEAKNE